MRDPRTRQHRFARTARRLRVALAATTLAMPLMAVPLAALASAAAATPHATPTAAAVSAAVAAVRRSPARFPFCSWWFETTAQTTNVALPDTSAAYWTTPFFAEPGMTISLKGQYPNARFMSTTVYDNSGGVFTRNGVVSSLIDYQIAPDRGTRNPFQQAARRPGKFTLTIQRHVAPGQTNVLPLVPSHPTRGGLLPPGFGFIVYRTYLPQGGNFNAVPLPTMTITRHGHSQTLSRCPTHGAAGVSNPLQRVLARWLQNRISAQAAAQRPTVRGPSGPAAFVRPLPERTNSYFPNPANAYLAAIFDPTPGTVVVVRGKAATATPGSTAQPWPNPAYQMRYWSMCNNVNASPYPVVAITDPQTDKPIYGCAPDDQTTIVHGHYTYVLSTLAERPPNATPAQGVTWLPYSQSSSATPVQDVLLLRNMLADAFPHSVQQVPEDGTAASARKVMGAYYPRIAQCSVAVFTRGGANACFVAGHAPKH